MGYDPATVLSNPKFCCGKAGLKKGDVITEYQGYHIDLGKDLYVYSYLNELKEGDTIRLKVKRDGKEQEISYKPDVNVRYLLGFNRSDVNSMTVESLIKDATGRGRSGSRRCDHEDQWCGGPGWKCI